jgi:RHS repeat-associated protein
VAHDAQGQRLRAMYSLAGKVVHEERLGKGASEYIYVGGRLLATRSSTGVTWTHVDALGSPVAVTDRTGSVVERGRIEPYGAELGGQVKDGPGYTGHVSDSATGLVYMQQRYMDPQLGMFLSVDPVTAYQKPVDQFIAIGMRMAICKSSKTLTVALSRSYGTLPTSRRVRSAL